MSVKKVNKTTGATTKVAGLVNSAKIDEMYGAFPSDASASNKLVSDATANEKISDAIAGKADKVSSATNGNFAGLNASGNLTDSGKKASDFATAQELANEVSVRKVMASKNIFAYTNPVRTTSNLSNLKSINSDGSSIRVSNSTAASWRSGIFLIDVIPNTDYIVTAQAVYTSGVGKLDVRTPSDVVINGCSTFNGNTDISFTFNSGDNTKLWLVMVITRSTSEIGDITFNNTMIRLASDSDATFEPYAKTNRQLTVDSVDWKNNSVLGAKNLLHTDGSQTTQGVLFECDENGVFTVTRQTASSNHAYYSNGRFTLKPGMYIFSNGYDSLPSGIQATYLYNHTDGAYFINCNDGPKAFSLTAEKELAFNIEVQSSQSPSNVKIYPMIRLASDNDATYQPYTKTNQELTKDSVDWDDFNKVGAVNLLPNNKAVGTTTSTDGHVTWTVNADGSVTISADGQQTADTPFILCSASQWEKQPSGRYRLSGCPSGGSTTTYYLQTQMKDGSGSNVTMVDYGIGKVSSFDQNVSMATNGNIFITVCKNTVVNNITFYPMFARVGYKGSYVPYARTNKELTDDAINLQNTKQDKPASNMAFARYIEWQGADTTRRLTMTANRARKTLLLMDNQNVAFVYFNEASAPIIAKVNGFANLTITLVSGTLRDHGTAVYDITGLTAWGSHVIADFAQYTNGNAYDVLTLSAVPTT